MASTEVEYAPPPPKKTGFAKKLDSFGKFLYNKQKGEVLGRNGSSWAQIGLFYLIFYSCLAGFFAAMMAVFFATLDRDQPRLYGPASIMNNNPSLGFRPLPDVKSTLIRFEQNKPATYKTYVDHIRAWLRNYDNDRQSSETLYQNCETGQREPDKVCKFRLETLGEECTWQKDFGYDRGQPCVLLKLNKMVGWEPDTYKDADEGTDRIRNLTAKLGGTLAENAVAVTCEGENPPDKENIGPIKFWPDKGFSKDYFPYMNQQGYRQPLVFAQFQRPVRGVLIQVVCRVWAKNILNEERELDSMHRQGSVHFELLVD